MPTDISGARTHQDPRVENVCHLRAATPQAAPDQVKLSSAKRRPGQLYRPSLQNSSPQKLKKDKPEPPRATADPHG